MVDVAPRQDGFEGKVAIVTGSTQGVGLAIAELMIARGLSGLVVTGRNTARGEEVAQRLASSGAKVIFIPADLTLHRQVLSIPEACDATFGRVDILVNAAGNTDRGTILDTDESVYDAVFNVNTKAPFYLMQACLQSMVRNNIKGSIANIISMSAHGGQSFLAAYCSAKGALLTLTRNTAFSMMRYGCRINGLCIGWTYSPGEEQTMRKWHGATEGWRETAQANLPIGRMLNVDEIARVVAFMCSDESGMMTGSILDFDQSMPGCFDVVPQPPRIPLGIQAGPPVGGT